MYLIFALVLVGIVVLLGIWPTVEGFAHDVPFIDTRLCIRKSTIANAGYGVFTLADIPKDTVIEVCHGIVLNEDRATDTLGDYVYHYAGNQVFVSFGFGGMYNHHITSPSVDYTFKGKLLVFSTNRNISAGEELFVDYGHQWCQSHNVKCATPRIVGENPCTWGPSFFCLNHENAKKCGMNFNDCTSQAA